MSLPRVNTLLQYIVVLFQKKKDRGFFSPDVFLLSAARANRRVGFIFCGETLQQS